MKGNKMKLNFKNTYNNVKFFKNGRTCYNVMDKEKFVEKVKADNPNAIIVAVYEECDDYDDRFGGYNVTVISMTADNDNNIDYEFIDEFFEKEYFELVQLLGDKSLSYWEDEHYDHNSLLLHEIESSYDRLRTEEDERDLCFENLVDAFENLRTFEVSAPGVDGLSSKSIECLIEYNNIIESFKNKFNGIKDELAKKVGITENS